jgi:crotonobetainyl-CoA:carnitine CoA-transferase CaiB-like acyl-CoA transferase
MDRAALAGTNVLDFSWAFAGPFVGAYLADFGARVIKVESHSHLDVTRVTSPYRDGVAGVNRSGCFPVANNSKLGITLNLRHPRARPIIEKLISWADIVVENFGAGVMERRGLGYGELKKAKPDIIMLSATIQGQTGPRSTFAGYGWNTVALTGIANLTGWPDRSPVGTIQAYPDSVVPWFGVIAVLAAMDFRRRTGKGQYIDMSQYETTAQFLSPILLDYATSGRLASREGNRCPYAAPHGVYACRGDDRWCAISVFSDSEWRSLRLVLGSPVELEDEKYASLDGRKANEETLDEIVARWTSGFTPEEVMERMQHAGVPAGVVKTNREVLEDPQLGHRNYFRGVEHTEMGQCLQQSWPIDLSRSPLEVGAAPCLGEHNEFVYTKILGLSDHEFVDLLNDGAFD